MAQKRMFSLSVVDTDKFLEMPISSRLLYYELGMRADDDGFVDNWRKILMFTGLKEDDMKVLIAKNFIIPFDSGVIVIRHWRMNNYLQNDRIKPTIYQDELNQLYYDKTNNVYTLDTQCIHSIDKNSIDKNSIEYNICSNENLFEAFWEAYPKKKNKGNAEKWFKAHKPSKELVNTMLEKLKQQKDSNDWKKNDGQFIPYPATWLNAKAWEDEYEEKIQSGSSSWLDTNVSKKPINKEEKEELEDFLKSF